MEVGWKVKVFLLFKGKSGVKPTNESNRFRAPLEIHVSFSFSLVYLIKGQGIRIEQNKSVNTPEFSPKANFHPCAMIL